MRLAALLLLVLTPVSLAAQDRRLADRLDPATAAAVQRVVDSAGRAGLPTEPLVQKALEGSTLGAPGDRIEAAVVALHGQLGRAREALGREAGEPELTAAAGALRAGLPPAALKRLQALRSGRPLVVPIAVLTDLVAEGVPPDEATRSVLALAREGRSDDEFVALRREVQTRRRGGQPGGPLDRPPLKPAPDPPVDR
ncbi:MAG TPA: hypothetical protein VMN37_04420 [Gemmatimonadales bacterium]|nr:hypothetical protein [Gemmatimonadales bacterium]